VEAPKVVEITPAPMPRREPQPQPTPAPEAFSGRARPARSERLPIRKLRLGTAAPQQTAADPSPTAGDATGSGAPQRRPSRGTSADAPQALRFKTLLSELSECSDDRTYRTLAKHIQERAIELAETGLMDECYDAILMIADHAAGDGTRTPVQQRCAETMLDLLLQEDQLTDLIQRAASRNTRTDLRAVQILVQLGARAVPALIATLAADRDPTRVSRIESLVLALDDRATPALRSSMFEGKPSHRRLAVQLAAKVRDPSLVPALMDLLGSESAELRRLAAEGLIEIGGRSCINALVKALKSPIEHLPELAAACLGEIGDRRALTALLENLDSAFKRKRVGLARELIHALARLQDERAVPALVSMVDRRGFFRRRLTRTLQLEALTALGRMSGSEARRAVFRALHSRDSAVREKAEELVAEQREAEQRRTAPAR
jgi:HEAT repeat protein